MWSQKQRMRRCSQEPRNAYTSRRARGKAWTPPGASRRNWPCWPPAFTLRIPIFVLLSFSVVREYICNVLSYSGGGDLSQQRQETHTEVKITVLVSQFALQSLNFNSSTPAPWTQNKPEPKGLCQSTEAGGQPGQQARAPAPAQPSAGPLWHNQDCPGKGW